MEDEKFTEIALNVEYGGFSVSEEALAWMKDRGLDFESHNYKLRIHPVLIAAVKKFGDKFPEPEFPTRIMIEEFGGDEFYIEEYDGVENVVTPYSRKFFSVKELMKSFEQ